jgi:uncharacterized protein YwqG
MSYSFSQLGFGSELSAMNPALQKDLEATIKPFLKVGAHVASDSDRENLLRSNFGGLPYLPEAISYPKGRNGEYLPLLAQINFTEMPHLEGFPEQGLLQFYFEENDDYLDADFQVLYLPTFNSKSDQPRTNFDFLSSRCPQTYPVRESYSLSFTRAIAPVSDAVSQFERIVESHGYKDVYGYEDIFNYGREGNQMSDIHKEILSGIGHKIGGYPCSTQGPSCSPFGNNPNDPDVLLLQIDSCDEIDWGGSLGVGNFFIREAALNQGDFSQVKFHFDCT